jgi:hypothetical protein
MMLQSEALEVNAIADDAIAHNRKGQAEISDVE